MGHKPYRFTTPDGDRITAKAVSPDDWVDWDGNTPVCKDCKFELDPIDKYLSGVYWIWTLHCQCCERTLDLKNRTDKVERSVDLVKQEYATSFMSEEALERSLESVLPKP